MTWKEFKDILEKKGVTDNMELSYIDIMGHDKIGVEIHDDYFIVQSSW